MLNGRELWTMLSKEMDEFAISIRMKLFKPPPINTVWLVLCSDLSLNKYQPLPQNIQHFYASQLNFTPEEENPNYSEVNYGSWKKSPEKDYKSTQSINNSATELNISTEKVNQSLNQINLDEDSLDVKPKLRPILGAGASLLRQETKNPPLSAAQDSYETWSKSSLSKRYDLNSWRQNGEEPKEEELVFNPSVLPPNLNQFSQITIPDYPPPFVPNSENFANYGQGDGKYVQNQYNEPINNSNATTFSQGDGTFISQPAENLEKNTAAPNETQKTPNADRSRRPVENWRKDKSDSKEEGKSRTKARSKQSSKDNLEEDKEEKGERRCSSRSNKEGRRGGEGRKKSDENKAGRRHVTDVPRGQKYWDHDDRYDKDYNDS